LQLAVYSVTAINTIVTIATVKQLYINCKQLEFIDIVMFTNI